MICSCAVRAVSSVKVSVLWFAWPAAEAAFSMVSWLQATSPRQSIGASVSEMSLRIVFLPGGFECIHALMEIGDLVEVSVDVGVYELSCAGSIGELGVSKFVEVLFSSKNSVDFGSRDGFNDSFCK